MNIVIRVDSSTIIGSGHVMRCLTLADTLREQGTKVIFICRQLPGNMCGFIEEKGYQVYCLPYNMEDFNGNIDENLLWLGATMQIDAEQTSQILHKISANSIIDWLIVDHYGLDSQWEKRMRSYIEKIMVIDDLANRYHDCDILLDQNLYVNMQRRYTRIVPEQCQILLGPQYAILRSDFYEFKKKVQVRNGIVKRILVFFGGSDLTDETTKTLKAIQILGENDICVDVVVGNINPQKENIKELCNKIPNATFYCQINNMAELMVRADLAIGAGGTATWERLCLGLPSLIIAVAENQVEIAQSVAKEMCAMYLGYCTNVSTKQLAEALLKCIHDPNKMQEMSLLALQIVDGQGKEKIRSVLSR